MGNETKEIIIKIIALFGAMITGFVMIILGSDIQNIFISGLGGIVFIISIIGAIILAVREI